MAIHLPTQIVDVGIRWFFRGQPTRSGDNATAADIQYGLRGVNSELNHAYAYRVHQVCNLGGQKSRTSELFSTTSTSYVNLVTGMYGPHHFCDDVRYVVVVADMVQAFIQIEVNGSAQAGSGVTTRAVDTATLDLSTGGDIGDLVPYRVMYKAQSGQTGEVYRLAVYELVLTTSEFS